MRPHVSGTVLLYSLAKAWLPAIPNTCPGFKMHSLNDSLALAGKLDMPDASSARDLPGCGSSSDALKLNAI